MELFGVILLCLILSTAVHCDQENSGKESADIVEETGNGFDLLAHRVHYVDQVDVANCVGKLIEKYLTLSGARRFRGESFLIKIIHETATIPEILISLVRDYGKSTLVVKDSRNFEQGDMDTLEKINTYIIIISDLLDIINDLNIIHDHPSWNPGARFFLVAYLNTITESNIKMIFNHMRSKKILDSYVLYIDKNSKTIFSYTWYPYGKNNCGVKCEEIQYLDFCSNANVVQVSELERKIPLNLHRCPIKVLAIQVEPFITPEFFTNKSFLEVEMGIEGSFIWFIADSLNTTIIPHQHHSYVDGVDEIYKNVDLTNEKYDLFLGNLFPSAYSPKYDLLVSYFQDRLTWCVPKAAFVSFLESMQYVFTKDAWILLLSSTFLVCIVVLVIESTEKKVKCFRFISILMTLLTMLIGKIALFFISNNPYRIMFSCWLLFSIVSNVIFQSSLRSFLIDPPLKSQVNTLTELYDSNFITGGHKIHDISQGINTVDVYRHCVPLNKCLEDAIDGKFAIYGPYSLFQYIEDFIIAKSRQVFSVCMKEDQSELYIPLVLTRKHYPLRARIQEMANRLFQSGIWSYWNQNLNRNTKEINVIRSPTNSIDLFEIQDVFVTYMIAIGVSILVFLIEVGNVMLRKCIKDNIHRIL